MYESDKLDILIIFVPPEAEAGGLSWVQSHFGLRSEYQNRLTNYSVKPCFKEKKYNPQTKMNKKLLLTEWPHKVRQLDLAIS